MMFRNTTGKVVKVRLMVGSIPIWKSIGPNDLVDLPKQYGLNLGFEPAKVVSKQESAEVVETKVFKPAKPSKAFRRKLLRIKGIGNRIANDILRVFPTEKALRQAIRAGKRLPFRNDIELKLMERFG